MGRPTYVQPEPQYHSPRRIRTSWERQYNIEADSVVSSIGNNAIGVQNPGQSAGFINYPPACQQDKCLVRTLQLEAGSSFQGSECSLGALGTRVTMSIPSIQYDRESYDQDSSSRVPLSCSFNLASLLYSLEQCKYQ